MKNTKQQLRRQIRTRGKVRRLAAFPRLSVYRSNTHIYAQVIDDAKHQTVCGVSEKQLDAKEKMTKTAAARLVGMELAKIAKEKKITKVVFDKGQYAYHGRVKALADGAREGGLEF